MLYTIRLTIIAAIGLLCVAAIAAKPDEIKPGLACEIFDFDQDDPLDDFPVIPAGTKPAVQKIDSRIAVDAAAQPWPNTPTTSSAPSTSRKPSTTTSASTTTPPASAPPP